MSRTIKFRAWDKKCKEKDLQMFSWREMCDMHMNMFFDDYHGRFELMQYTGLHDKHGKEIYEGDIVFISRYLDEPDGDGSLYLAKWETFGFAIRRQITILNGLKKESKPSALINRSAVEHHSEVVGNVWENPELLEAQND